MDDQELMTRMERFTKLDDRALATDIGVRLGWEDHEIAVCIKYAGDWATKAPHGLAPYWARRVAIVMYALEKAMRQTGISEAGLRQWSGEESENAF